MEQRATMSNGRFLTNQYHVSRFLHFLSLHSYHFDAVLPDQLVQSMHEYVCVVVEYSIEGSKIVVGPLLNNLQ